jgi:hypothetical protein
LQQLRERIANAPLCPSEIPAGGNIDAASSSSVTDTHRPRSWLAPRGGWLR